MKYQDVGDRGDPSTDGILNKLDEIACLVAEQLFDDIHRLDNGSDLYALESNPHSQNRAELLRSGFSFECGKALREMLIHYAANLEGHFLQAGLHRFPLFVRADIRMTKIL